MRMSQLSLSAMLHNRLRCDELSARTTHVPESEDFLPLSIGWNRFGNYGDLITEPYCMPDGGTHTGLRHYTDSDQVVNFILLKKCLQRGIREGVGPAFRKGWGIGRLAHPWIDLCTTAPGDRRAAAKKVPQSVVGRKLILNEDGQPADSLSMCQKAVGNGNNHLCILRLYRHTAGCFQKVSLKID